jgi:glycosyltransferase involved in cell wall biosynthesis
MSRMKLLINCRFLTRPLTGVDRTASELVRALAALARSGELDIECAVPRGAPPDVDIRASLDLSAGTRIHRSILSGYTWEQVVLARLQPESMLLSLCNIGPVVRANQLVMIHDAQVHDSPESYSPAFRFAYRLLQPLLARRAKAVVTVSAHSRSRMQANGLGQDRPIHVVHNGADHFAAIRSDPAVLDRLDLRSGDYLFALAHHAKHKNIAMLQRACRRRSDRRMPLILAGQGTAATIEGNQSGIRFVGRVSDGELKALYEHARLFLFPSLTEGFGFPVLEAMSCGCPVIASDAGAITEVAGAAAVLCDPGDEAAWTRAIDALQYDDARLASLAAAGKVQAGQFTWQRSAQAMLALLPQSATNARELSINRQAIHGSPVGY